MDIEIPLGPAGSDYTAATERLTLAADQFRASVLGVVRSADVRQIRLRFLPSTVAVPYAQIDTPGSIRDKFSATLAASEAAVRYLALLSLIPVGGRTRELRLRKLAGELDRKTTLGGYVKIVRENFHRLQVLLPEATQALRTRSGRPTALGSFIFDKLTNMRNELHGHGAPMPQAAYVEPFQQLRGYLDGLLAALARDGRSTALVVRANLEFGQKKTHYDYILTELRGDSVGLPSTRVVTKQRLDADMVYLWRRESADFIDADPLLVYGVCPRCQFAEAFYLDHLDPKTPKWFSYRAGHRFP